MKNKQKHWKTNKNQERTKKTKKNKEQQWKTKEKQMFFKNKKTKRGFKGVYPARRLQKILQTKW